MSLKREIEVAIGIEDHYAWANLVSVRVSGSSETLLDSRRVELLDPCLPSSPYHGVTLGMTRPDAEQLVRDVQASANELAHSALASLIRDLAPAKCVGIAIRVPPLAQLPASVAAAHADRWVMNRADGMIYHHALTQAATHLRLPVFHFEKDTVVSQAAQARETSAQELEQYLKAFGKAPGRSWRKGQVIACAGAILSRIGQSADVA